MRPTLSRLPVSRLTATALLLALAACADGAPPAATADATSDSGAVSKDSSSTTADIAGPKPSGDPQFIAAFAPVVQAAADLSVAEFMAKWLPKDAAKPIVPTYKPTGSKYMDLIDKELALTPAEKARLDSTGFMVSDRLQRDTMGKALHEIFKKDLPVAVTTDAILQALHASYDDILKTLEEHVLLDEIDNALAKAHAATAKVAVGTDPMAAQARGDADLYLTVARSLLAGNAVKAQGGAAIDEAASKLLALVAKEQMAGTTIFGSERVMDFSQFKPRGHYNDTEALKRYFRAVMWLGRVDLRFAEPDANKGVWVYRPRQVMAAVVLQQAVDAGAAAQHVQTADDLLSLMVGPIDYITLQGVAALIKDQKWETASDVGKLTPTQADALVNKLAGGAYGTQKIASHYLETNPHSEVPTPLPPSFALLGQRFIIDSQVFSNVVYDRVMHKGQKVQRVLPDPLDVAFALGNSQAAVHLEKGFGQYPYQGALHTVRWLVDQHDATFWQGNLYNLWLDGLRAMNPPTTDNTYPFALRTPAWRDKVLNTQLGSWAQLRHDTLLYAKQSYTGSVACEHPSAWVEPYPAFFAKMAKISAVAKQTLVNATPKQPYVKQQLTNFFGEWQSTMEKLQAIAQRELDGKGTADDQAFLKQIISSTPGCGEPVYTGWYPKLFFQPDNVDKWKPTIADVHTNPNTGPLPGPNVLHVATGNVSLMVITIDNCAGGGEAFVGPVFRYHEVDVKEIKRLDDKEWETMLKDGKAPLPPAWTDSFRVPL